MLDPDGYWIEVVRFLRAISRRFPRVTYMRARTLPLQDTTGAGAGRRLGMGE